MTTIHAYTGNQNILDAPSKKDWTRGRAGALNMVPTTTGAAKAVALVLPELKGKFNGMAVRVPTPTVSLVDLVVELNAETTVEQINAAMKEAAEGPLKGVLQYNDEPLVSKDFQGNPHSSIFHAESTMVLEGKMVKVLSWYDNEWGYSCRLIDLIRYMAQKGL
jgi:glyceraldehyde 3-phosphate dehydrogenase